MEYGNRCIYSASYSGGAYKIVRGHRSCPLEGKRLPASLQNTLLRRAVLPLMRPLLLCIEDNPTHLTLRKAVLEGDGFNVIGVTNVRDALRVLRETPVCATIADHMLQGTTGAELVKEMKRIKPEVPVILFSGTIPQRLNGVDVYINKGEATATFLSIVRAVVQHFCR
jgi:CheY-like chemotaxis protein